MMLAAEYKSQLDLIAEGIDAQELIDEVTGLFDAKFNEE